MSIDLKAVTREILLAFCKVHILHHAAKGPVVGQWMMQELRPTASTDYKTRSGACQCIRFRKSALKDRSRLFRWLDGYLNPLFNRLRDSLLTQQELDEAQRFAADAVQATGHGARQGASRG